MLCRLGAVGWRPKTQLMKPLSADKHDPLQLMKRLSADKHDPLHLMKRLSADKLAPS